MPFALILKAAGGFLLDALRSRAGQIVLAFAVAWAWSAHRTNTRWEARVAAERAAAEAAYRAEVARQEAAARDIAREATERLAAEQAAAADMRGQITELERAEKHAPDTRVVVVNGKKTVSCRPCAIDDDFLRRLRNLDAVAGARKAPRRAR